MHSEIINIPWLHVSITTLFIVGAGLCSIYLKLGLERDLLIGTVRTFLQLGLLGYVLKAIFSISNPVAVFLLFSLMIFFAARIISGRVMEKRVPYFLPVLASMFLSYMLINMFVMSLIINVKPWYYPVYFIPVGGMIIGNSMNAVSLSINSWFEGLKKDRDRVELFLSLGADPQESTIINFKESVKTGMIPSINALMSVGIVSIPGMMSGQILAGTDPLIAVKYQVIIMLILAGSTAITTVLALFIVRRLSFSGNHQLRI
ncbi:MAG: iron export ABC transporter permease subunit FetB [Nitrospiraceae bacterium]|nr:MAG: iron export ABC transporter permease subunit FetB [Nitrospiraceae bacterium]